MPKKEPSIAIVILAAGASKRMGQPKQLMDWKGSSFLSHAIKQASASKAQDIYVVLGAHAEAIINETNFLNAQSLINPKWLEGLGSSVACAAQNLSDKNYDALLFMLVDQVQIDTELLNQLIDAYQQNPKNIIACAYPKSLGVPAIIPKSYNDELMQLDGAAGARSIINRHKEQCIAIEAQVQCMDIDTPEQYREMTSSYANIIAERINGISKT